MIPSVIRAARPTAQRFAAGASAPSSSAATGKAVDPYAHKSLFWKMVNPENNTLKLQRQFQAERAAGIPTHLMGRGKYYYPVVKWALVAQSFYGVYVGYLMIFPPKDQ